MAALMQEVKSVYDTALEAADARVADWPLMGSPLPALSIVALYNVFVRYAGPKMMENRPPMELKRVMILYNVVLILINGWFVEESMRRVWLVGRYHLYKEPVDYSNDPFAVYVTTMVYWFFITKILDLFDTVFMVLRKKSNQTTFLHVYHHSAMVMVIWSSVKFIGGGSPIMVGTVNAFVHTIMYTYYLLTLINPEYKKSVWWKRHLTELQLVQFVFLVVFASLVWYHTDSKMIRIFCGLGVPQDTFFFFMFWDFYRKTYLTKKKSA